MEPDIKEAMDLAGLTGSSRMGSSVRMEALAFAIATVRGYGTGTSHINVFPPILCAWRGMWAWRWVPARAWVNKEA